MTKMLSEILEQPKVLARVESNNDRVLNELVGVLERRGIRHVVLAARGTSDHAGMYGAYLLSVYKGVVAGLAMPSSVTIYHSDIDYRDDLVIGVSQSGKAADVLAVLEQAKKSGAVTVSVTNNPDSPMAGAADYHLDCSAGPELSVAATKTFTSEMYLLALLTARWSRNDDLSRALKALPDAAAKLLDTCQDGIVRQADRFHYVTEGFAISRGFSYPVALEAALKVQETCYIKMKGYASSDFYHGPLAQLDADIPVILLAPKGKAFEDLKQMTEKVKALGIDPLVVTNDAELARQNRHGLLLPDTGSEATQAFLFAIFAQRFAEYLSVSRGLNPDAPRRLKKVTITH